MSSFVSTFLDFDSQDKLVNAFAQEIIIKLQQAIEQKGKATLLLSGGNTPKPLLAFLSKMTLDWDRVYISLCDERWVEDTHNDSNAKLVKEYLLQNKAQNATFIPMYQEGLNAQEAEQKSSEAMQLLLPFDVLILGMGEDGHIASLFPNNQKLQKALDLQNPNLCISMIPQNAKHDRMSLTLSAILKSSNIYFHIEGANKLSVYKKALHADDIYQLPVSSVLNNASTKVYYCE